MWAFSSSKIVRFLLAPLLSFWVAGAGCMLGCEGMVAAAAAGAIEQNGSGGLHSEHSSTIVASGHACSSGGSSAASSGEVNKSHNCCKKGTTEVKPKTQRVSPSAVTLIESGASSSGTMKDCPLAGSKEAVVTKSRRGDASASPAVAHSYLPAQKLLEQLTPLSNLPLLPNRGHTYLRCCVFLI
jgi:hypothetical protein